MGVLTAEHLTTGYGEQIISENLNYTFHKGTITSIIGPNGCGKSTFLKTLARVLPGQNGSVLLDGKTLNQYSSKEIAIPASCQQFTVRFKHAGSMPKAAMGHNVVVAKSSDLNGVIKDGMKAGPAADYVKAGDERVLAKTKLLGGGESDSLTLDVAAIKAAPYSFVCTFPGHTGSMRGTIVIK